MLFDNDEEWEELKESIQTHPDIKFATNIDILVTKVKNILATSIQNKVAALLKQNKSVIFAINFSNNQDDFRHQGAELKHVIDFVRPASHRKVDVVAHSMGCLATASYISGIAGVPFAKDIDQFVALGAPFNGSGLAIPGKPFGNSLDQQLQKQQQHGFIAPYKNKRPPVYPVISDARLNPTKNQPTWNEHLEGFRTRGPAYEYLQKTAWQLQTCKMLGQNNIQPRESGHTHYNVQSPIMLSVRKAHFHFPAPPIILWIRSCIPSRSIQSPGKMWSITFLLNASNIVPMNSMTAGLCPAKRFD